MRPTTTWASAAAAAIIPMEPDSLRSDAVLPRLPQPPWRQESAGGGEGEPRGRPCMHHILTVDQTDESWSRTRV